MKHPPTLWSVLAIIVLGAVHAVAAPPDDKRTVADLDTAYQAAVKANDAATMDRILADDFILIEGDGTVSRKADLLNEARSRRINYEHQEESVQTVRVWGDSAVVTAKLWGQGTNAGKPFDWTLWFSDTYVRTATGWRYVLGQASLPLPETSSRHIDIPLITAAAEDVSSPEAIVKADYETISGGVGVPRQWARALTLYDPNARQFSVYKDTKSGALTMWNPTLQGFADEANSHLVSEGFTEHEVAHKIYRFGNVATMLSSYEGKFASGKLYSSGVNIYQLYYAGKRWWISSVSWDAENDINPIPSELQAQK
jgi:ketosteroid isomerase-like protein